MNIVTCLVSPLSRSLTLCICCGTATVNVALNKLAYQDTTSEQFRAELAVDGKVNGNHKVHGCSHTDHSTSHWWVVDFGIAQTVRQIQISNRIDYKPERLHNFTVGLTNTLPTTTTGPEKSPHQVCLVYEGAFPATRQALTCTNTTKGRYLFIHLAGHDSVLTLCEVEVYYHFERSMIEMTGYRNDYNLSDVIDLNNATCQQVTTPKSDTSFRLRFQLPTVHDRLTLTAVLDNGDCLDFPATMVYTEGDRSVLTPYNNNPSFCDTEPGKCVFECDCSAMPCQEVYLIILSDPYRPRSLCEIYLTWK
ncbi:hypothetical protein LSAT2_008808 [Lamellibrachia satsuma]|nr:hypothetical protein LSAT2_008808 [Lamellibrachia satsuma]